jgi:hypothetical protein
VTLIYNSMKPLAKAGQAVRIEVDQTLQNPITSEHSEDMLDLYGPNTVALRIEGPQTELTPAHIAGVYPAPGSEESPDEFLPHIAFTRRTLPWERYGPDWKQADPQAPWLALLVLTDVEKVDQGSGAAVQAASPTNPASIRSGPPEPDQPGPGPVRPAPARPARLQRMKVKDIGHPATRARLAECNLALSTDITVISVPNAMLREILPTLRELELLCHVKRETEYLDLSHRRVVYHDTAIVVANRLPYAGGENEKSARHTAVLVSLEKRDDLYYDAAGNLISIPPAGSSIPPAGSTPLLVLSYWDFTPSQGGDFEEVMKRIRLRPNGGVLRFGNLPQLAERISPPRFQSLVDADGYLREPLPQTLSDKLKITYHSPLLPFAAPPRSDGLAIRAAPEEFANADQNTPLDYSHAVAFELGRMLALADPALLEDLRNIVSLRPHFEIGLVAVDNLPVALRKPSWVINPANEAVTPENWLDQLDWVDQQIGQDSILRKLPQLKLELDPSGIVGQPWNANDAVEQELARIGASTPAVQVTTQGGLLDIANVDVEQLEQRFIDLRNVGLT